jgi:hypothetical protein
VANLDQEQLRRLARLGAVARLEQLRAEEEAIRQEFPELFGGGRGRPRRGRKTATTDGAARPARRGRRRNRKPMSAAARKAVSERMRKYWAERRKAKGGK